MVEVADLCGVLSGLSAAGKDAPIVTVKSICLGNVSTDTLGKGLDMSGLSDSLGAIVDSPCAFACTTLVVVVNIVAPSDL